MAEIFLGLLILTVIILILMFVQQVKRYKLLARKYNELLAGLTEANAIVEAGQSTANNFLDACRLIAIHRSGRMNTFTFVRGNASFMIQTMGLMSDVPDDWRKQAGLDQ